MNLVPNFLPSDKIKNVYSAGVLNTSCHKGDYRLTVDKRNYSFASVFLVASKFSFISTERKEIKYNSF
jgi:hypothetical protein